MEEITSGISPDFPIFSAEFPLKSKLCLFCVEPITTKDLLVNDDKDNSCDFNCEPELISPSTFLQAISLFCDFLKVDQRFRKLEQWALFGVDNFTNFLCCNECALLLQKLVKLQNLILETQASLKSEIEALANQILFSSFKSTEEYSINACVQFRQEIIKNYPVHNEEINKTQPSKSTPTTRKRPTYSKGTSMSRPMPLIKKKTSAHVPTKPAIIPESFVKLERLDIDPSNLSNPDSNHLEDINEGSSPSPSISLKTDNCDSDVDYEPTPAPRHRHQGKGKGHSKRGRPPKSKSPKKLGRPPNKPKSKIDEGDQDYIPPNENSEDDPNPNLEDKLKPPTKIKRPRARPLKVGSRLHRSLHSQGPIHKPIYLLPPSPPSPSSSTSPHHHHLLMYFNVPFHQTPSSLLCLHPSCTFSTPLSSNSPSHQTAYTTMRLHIRHLHRFKSSTSLPHLYYCHLCSTHFDNRLSFLHHRKSLHWTTPLPPVLCQVCGCPLPSTSHLLKHLSSHKSPEELSALNLAAPRRADPLKLLSHPCDECPKSFKCFTELRTHKSTHIPLEIRRQHQCHLCGEKFINHNTLKGHLDRVHLKTMSQDLVCRYCSRKFFNRERNKYEAHLRTHTGEKPYQCAECGKDFHQKWNLTMHERLHGEDTVSCEFCSESFKTQKYLRRHQRKHHPQFVQKPDPKETRKYKNVENTQNFIGPRLMFPCEPCQHVYKFKSILVSHLKRMHQMNYDKSEDFPNMWTFEDEGWIVNGLNERPPPPGGWRGRVKKSKIKKDLK